MGFVPGPGKYYRNINKKNQNTKSFGLTERFH